ncbi:hypothetical protein RHGRI_031253 [Rhododendron griersonianum]|uniref:Vps53 C-terminal domain-containing protein n=1 Tax=Rhododendron griersonianum TaxID=479676 RepID=A0AAV6I9Q0_9ERIC|nr:hypothetical protein RHGRI_031253 [Rhododendron griersonianum]
MRLDREGAEDTMGRSDTLTVEMYSGACIVSWSTLLPQYFQVQANIRNRSPTNVVGHSGYKDHSFGYSPSWKTGEFILVNNMNSLTSGASNYSKFVSREMSKAEALLKVILSPIDSVADTYRALLPEGTPSEFQRILELKVSTTPGPPVLLAVPTAPPAPTIANPSSAGVIASREDVLTRAAALGRGAATTGFKRFLALTEAAKDRKDGPFRKLFNP